MVEDPTVIARREGDDLVVICPHCGEKHRHGAGGGYGHRIAHCSGRGTPAGRGYFLTEA
ncbi:hypothetical protein ACQEV9_18100 [Streptomyces chartreusis]|uniref:hypothetical protein n=1 Tax=Streptomyces chartreusis TaxID=1969 RepID=UPI003D946438